MKVVKKVFKRKSALRIFRQICLAYFAYRHSVSRRVSVCVCVYFLPRKRMFAGYVKSWKFHLYAIEHIQWNDGSPDFLLIDNDLHLQGQIFGILFVLRILCFILFLLFLFVFANNSKMMRYRANIIITIK